MRSAPVAALLLVLLPPAAAAGVAITVEVDEAMRIAGPQEVVAFPVDVRSLSDRDIRVAFDVVDASEGLQVPRPPPVTIARGQSAQLFAMAHTPYRNGYVNEVGAFTLRVTPQDVADAATKGEPKDVSFLVTTKGWYVPGPGALALVGVLAALALLVRRRV